MLYPNAWCAIAYHIDLSRPITQSLRGPPTYAIGHFIRMGFSFTENVVKDDTAYIQILSADKNMLFTVE